MTVSAPHLRLPRPDRRLEDYTPGPPSPYRPNTDGLKSRVAMAAAHVVADPLADINPREDVAIDWDATMAFRRHLWSHGLGVADAMDTAQRGMGLGWDTARELIAKSAAEAKAYGGKLGCGANTDQLPDDANTDLDAIERAYEEQCAYIEDCGAQVILMCSRHLARTAASADDYIKVYDRVIGRRDKPVILHWLGDMFDPKLRGYWGSGDLDAATETFLGLLETHRDRIDGIKMSLLDATREIDLRRKTAALGIRMYTGDDFGFADLIKGDGDHHSDALLGIFDAIAPAASAALAALDAGETARFDDILAPTVPLSRHIFKTPTWHYKTGIVFLAWLNGHQNHFRMIQGQESGRSIQHLAELFRLADQAQLLADPPLAAYRMQLVLAQAGIDG
ncbi:dihydrodipicolinate synthase family protein [Fodinicurvata sp. EGI_FJ10296]|uniref:dihydrodipicolinate synthase family protein n=1 Tax=Fodinicurvata sp. EGI_FJ10296 TaxID=3231908 RepID=UPI0034566BFE